MLLQCLEIHDFRCFSDTSSIPIHKLTVFIGENDSGKTAILAALHLLLTNDAPLKTDFRQLGENRTLDKFQLRGVFTIEDHDEVPGDYRTKNDSELILTKVFTESQVRITVLGRRFKDDRCKNFDRQPASIQKNLLQEFRIVPGSNAEQRAQQFQELLDANALEKEQAEVEVKFSEISPFLPKFEIIASADYRHPDALVHRTLLSVVDGFLRPENPESGQRELRPELVELRSEIKSALDQEVEKMKAILGKIHPRLQHIEVSPEIDFSRSVTATNLMVDVGGGPRLIDAFGEGTKKKLWMGLLDWQAQAHQDLKDISTIRAYDEPDVNLDYAAEKKLFNRILESTRDLESRTQAIVCTHALTLVDRAPGKSINHIRVMEDGRRAIHYLDGDTDQEVGNFLSTIGRSVGLSNSALFYEKAFLVVEGESEENALPILYRNLYRRSLIEDGIVLIPLYTCGAWKPILSVLNRYKHDVTVMLLDRDCLQPDSSAMINAARIREIGYPEDFFQKSCFFIGDKEFEDAFHSRDIAAVLNAFWPKEEGSEWQEPEVDQFRIEGHKFADDFFGHVRRTCIPHRRNQVRKPEFAEKLARHCQEKEQIPEVIQIVFEELRSRAGIVPLPDGNL